MVLADDVPLLPSVLRGHSYAARTSHLLFPKMSVSLALALALDRSRPGPLAGDTEDALSKIGHRLVELNRAFGSHSLAWRSFSEGQQRERKRYLGLPYSIRIAKCKCPTSGASLLREWILPSGTLASQPQAINEAVSHEFRSYPAARQ